MISHLVAYLRDIAGSDKAESLTMSYELIGQESQMDEFFPQQQQHFQAFSKPMFIHVHTCTCSSPVFMPI